VFSASKTAIIDLSWKAWIFGYRVSRASVQVLFHAQRIINRVELLLLEIDDSSMPPLSEQS
jgi:hypothetical protein